VTSELGVQRSDVVVIGASLAGLFAAAAAASEGRRVAVLERDVLPNRPQPRAGVPQGRQPHVFLYRGLLDINELLPGLRQNLLDLGAVPFNTGDLPWLGEHGWFPTSQRRFEVVSATRPLFEHVVAQRVLTMSTVTVHQNVRANALHRASNRWLVKGADGSCFESDLVVDASGRGSRLPHWLVDLGLEPPPTFAIDAHVGYATRMYLGGPRARELPGVVVAATPTTLTGGLALAVEGRQWLVLAAGFGDRRPPRDATGFTTFLAGLRDSALADLVAQCQPVTDVAVHRQTGNRRHLYDRIPNCGLLVIGDAFCSFNPVYGQGITVAASQALALREALASGMRPVDTGRLLRQFAALVAVPWAIATSEDLRFRTSSGRQSPSQALFGWWTRELGKVAVHGDTRAAAVLVSVYNLIAPPTDLLHPALAMSVLRARVGGYQPATPRPARVEALRRGNVDSHP
jgi:2-polyprenyl-6-methoxyphenol hydroxylase-like FAD-dependent oxidoreductase